MEGPYNSPPAKKNCINVHNDGELEKTDDDLPRVVDTIRNNIGNQDHLIRRNSPRFVTPIRKANKSNTPKDKPVKKGRKTNPLNSPPRKKKSKSSPSPSKPISSPSEKEERRQYLLLRDSSCK